VASSRNTAWQRMLPTLATFVLIVLVIGCLYWARPVLIPTAVAVLLTFVLSPVVTLLQRRGVPRAPAVILVVGAAGLAVLLSVGLIGSQMMQLFEDLPTYQGNVSRRISEIRIQGRSSLIDNVQQFLTTVTSAASRPVGTAEPVPATPVEVRVVESPWNLGSWRDGLQPITEPLAGGGMVIVLVVYLLLFREDARSRLLVLIGKGHLTVTTKALDDASRRISRYLLAQLILNVSFGISIGIGLWLIDIPYAPLWGFCAALLRYIPLLGPWLAAIFPIAMSLLASPGWLQPVLVISLFIALELLNNLVIEPWLYGQSIGVSQAAILVAIAFWTWLWGPMGLMLAAPLTVCLVVMGKYVPSLRFFDVMLGDEPVLTPDVALYQRLLANDEDEANDIVQGQAEQLTQLELCDRVLIPALVHAREDHENGLLEEHEFDFVQDVIRRIVEDIPLPQTPAGSETQASDRPPLSIVACASQNGIDLIALEMLLRALDPQTYKLEIMSTARLVSEVVDHVEQERPAAIVIAALPTGGLAHARHLCKRLRQRFGDLKIAVGRWGESLSLEQRQQLSAAGVDYISDSLAQGLEQIAELAQFLRPEAAPGEASKTQVSEPATTERLDSPHTLKKTMTDEPAQSLS
jgi:predicted PurR-regulated permease PerM